MGSLAEIGRDDAYSTAQRIKPVVDCYRFDEPLIAEAIDLARTLRILPKQDPPVQRVADRKVLDITQRILVHDLAHAVLYARHDIEWDIFRGAC